VAFPIAGSDAAPNVGVDVLQIKSDRHANAGHRVLIIAVGKICVLYPLISFTARPPRSMTCVQAL
jgi:hypothetical protein